MRNRLLNRANAGAAWRGGRPSALPSATRGGAPRGRARGAWAVAVLSASVVALPAVASAGQSGWFTLQRPGIACQSGNAPGVIASWSALYNGDNRNSHTFWCPLDNPNGTTGAISNVDVFVDYGYSGVLNRCVVSELVTPDTGWWFNANTWDGLQADQIPTPAPYADHDLAWNLPVVGPIYGAEVECTVLSGEEILGYSVRGKQYFDWTSW